VVKSKDNFSLTGIFNQRKKESKWRDVRLRKAVNYAVNRQELWRYCAKGNAWNLGGHIAPGSYGYNPELALFSFNTEKARVLLSEAGYPDGFNVKILTIEAWKLEAQIVSKMLERVGLRTELEVLPLPKAYKKIYIPYLDKPPEEQDWDILLFHQWDVYGNTGAIFLALFFIEEADFRWTEYDSVYENMWKEMAMTVDQGIQETKIRNLEAYLYDNAYGLFLYSPVTLYAVNKEVNFVPQENIFLRLKETSVTENHWSIRGKND
jgi:peptide/nickel transport system substrate-binding protein